MGATILLFRVHPVCESSGWNVAHKKSGNESDPPEIAAQTDRADELLLQSARYC